MNSKNIFQAAFLALIVFAYISCNAGEAGEAGENGEDANVAVNLKIAAMEIVYDGLYLFKDKGFYSYPELKSYHKKLVDNNSVQTNMPSPVLLLVREEDDFLIPDFSMEDKPQFFIKCLIYPTKDKVIYEVTVIFIPLSDEQARKAFPNEFRKNPEGLASIIPQTDNQPPVKREGIRSYIQKLE